METVILIVLTPIAIIIGIVWIMNYLSIGAWGISELFGIEKKLEKRKLKKNIEKHRIKRQKEIDAYTEEDRASIERTGKAYVKLRLLESELNEAVYGWNIWNSAVECKEALLQDHETGKARLPRIERSIYEGDLQTLIPKRKEQEEKRLKIEAAIKMLNEQEGLR